MTDHASWDSLLTSAIASNGGGPAAEFAQLATVATDGGPACRTVRFRFLLSDTRLVISTDLRSGKIHELAACPVAELCWYFPASREQFRLRGPMSAVGAEAAGELAAARARCWLERTGASRQGFTWPPPGDPLADPAAFEQPEPTDPPPAFGLLVMAVDRAEYLDVRPHPHVRLISARASGRAWRVVNP